MWCIPVGKSWPGTKDAFVRIQRIRGGDDHHASAYEANGPDGNKKSRMITKRVFYGSSGYSVARHAAPLLGMYRDIKVSGYQSISIPGEGAPHYVTCS
jgi:hypothetical protein